MLRRAARTGSGWPAAAGTHVGRRGSRWGAPVPNRGAPLATHAAAVQAPGARENDASVATEEQKRAVAEELRSLYADDEFYTDALTQLGHGLQSAALAARAGASNAVVVAALLHDVGWKLARTAPWAESSSEMVCGGDEGAAERPGASLPYAGRAGDARVLRDASSTQASRRTCRRTASQRALASCTSVARRMRRWWRNRRSTIRSGPPSCACAAWTRTCARWCVACL